MRLLSDRPGSRASGSRRGVSMLELMAAMVVIAFALFGVVSIITQTLRMREATREQEVAKEWCMKRIEEVKSQKFAQLNKQLFVAAAGTTLYTGTFANQANPASYPNVVDVGTPPSLAKAQGTLTVDYTNPSLCEIVVTLTWKSVKGNGIYTMRSLYSS